MHRTFRMGRVSRIAAVKCKRWAMRNKLKCFRFIAFGGGTRLRYHRRDANNWREKNRKRTKKKNANSIVRRRLTQLTCLKWINLRLSKLANHNAPYTVQHRIVCLNGVRFCRRESLVLSDAVLLCLHECCCAVLSCVCGPTDESNVICRKYNWLPTTEPKKCELSTSTNQTKLES